MAQRSTAQGSRVFISYSRGDKDFANRLRADLEARGFEIWLDTSDLADQGGQPWLRLIQNAIDSCQAMIVVLSPRSMSAQYVLMELDYALSKNKLVIPIHYRTVTNPPMELLALQWIEFREDRGIANAYQIGLTNLIHSLAKSPFVPSPPPPPRKKTTASSLFRALWILTLSTVLIVGVVSAIAKGWISLAPAPQPTTTSQYGANQTRTPRVSANTPTITATPAPNVLYSADWSQGLDGWQGATQWIASGGMLTSDGSTQAAYQGQYITLAPFHPQTSYYAVEAQIRVLACNNQKYGCSVGLLLHTQTSGAGYEAGVAFIDTPSSYPEAFIWRYDESSQENITHLTHAPYPTDNDWHTFKFVYDQPHSMRLYIDNSLVVTADDSVYSSPDQVGLATYMAVLQIRNFQVDAV